MHFNSKNVHSCSKKERKKKNNIRGNVDVKLMGIYQVHIPFMTTMKQKINQSINPSVGQSIGRSIGPSSHSINLHPFSIKLITHQKTQSGKHDIYFGLIIPDQWYSMSKTRNLAKGDLGSTSSWFFQLFQPGFKSGFPFTAELIGAADPAISPHQHEAVITWSFWHPGISWH